MIRRAICLLAAVAMLAACSADEEEPAVEPYVVTGQIGSAPVLQLTDALPLADPQYTTLIRGDGASVSERGTALLSVSTFSGVDGAAVGELAQPYLLDLETVSADSGLADALEGATEGSRIVSTYAVEDERGERMELTVTDVLSTIHSGDAVEIDFGAENLPVIAEGPDGEPTAEVPEGITEPESLRVVTLARADGSQVLPGDTIYAQYSVWTWHQGDVYDSTWDKGGVPVSAQVDELFPGLRDGLLDQNVGSRVLVLVPPEVGIGTDSLIAVVDILAVGRES